MTPSRAGVRLVAIGIASSRPSIILHVPEPFGHVGYEEPQVVAQLQKHRPNRLDRKPRTRDGALSILTILT